MRMVVVRNEDNSVSCLCVSKPRGYYESKYDVICFVNRLWNPYYVSIIKKYYG